MLKNSLGHESCGTSNKLDFSFPDRVLVKTIVYMMVYYLLNFWGKWIQLLVELIKVYKSHALNFWKITELVSECEVLLIDSEVI